MERIYSISRCSFRRLVCYFSNQTKRWRHTIGIKSRSVPYSEIIIKKKLFIEIPWNLVSVNVLLLNSKLFFYRPLK